MTSDAGVSDAGVIDVEIIDQGRSVRVGESRYRLKDLLPPDRLGAGTARAVAAGAAGEDRVRLVFADGTWQSVSVPARPTGSPEPDPDPHSGPADLAVLGAGQVLTMEGGGVGLTPGGAVLCRGGRVQAVVPGADLDAVRDRLADDVRIVDARGCVVTPGLVDPHTHPVFAGDRSVEFGLKAAGASYMEIHRAGGGILSTVRAVREARFEALAERCRRNLTRLLAWGVTTCEAKSGYDLTSDGELRLLEVIRCVEAAHPVDVVPTLLAAHTVPPEFAEDPDGYVDVIVEDTIVRAAARGLARYCDVYCEEGAFTPAQTERILVAAKEAGLGARIHAEQFTHQGGAELAARLGAASADHLEAVSDEGILALAAAGTTAVLLPGAALTCRCPWPPARALLDAGAPVALGTDLNPGSSLTSSLPLMMSLACMQMKVSCEEAWRAVTVVAARSLGLHDRGTLTPGTVADLCLFEVPDYRYVPYHYGENHLRAVVKGGVPILERRTA